MFIEERVRLFLSNYVRFELFHPDWGNTSNVPVDNQIPGMCLYSTWYQVCICIRKIGVEHADEGDAGEQL